MLLLTPVSCLQALQELTARKARFAAGQAEAAHSVFGHVNMGVDTSLTVLTAAVFIIIV